MRDLMSCHPAGKTGHREASGESRHLTIALAGNANVGKSVIFNKLTGSDQIIGNWPGKTVERAEGRLSFEGRDITVIDLPGIYSFSTYSMEEVVTREYIAREKPDVVINAVDVCVFERNLFFTLQLREMGVPLVICLNQMDVARKKGISVDLARLEAALGTPVVPTAAVRGEGLRELVATAVQVAERAARGESPQPDSVRFGEEIETRVRKLAAMIESERMGLEYGPRWAAIKLLENDPESVKLVSQRSEDVIQEARGLAAEIERIHGEPAYVVIASERYSVAHRIAGEVYTQKPARQTFLEKIDAISTHKVFGYLTSVAILAGLLLWTLFVGTSLSNLLSRALSFFQPVDPQVSGPLIGILWNGVFGGIVAGVTLVVPFVIPFYAMLAVMEDSGVLTRVAFMMDSAMHQMGLHGKAIIPLILGYGCNVPAIQSSRIMETRRERLLAAFAITFAPCAARTIVVLGLVAVFVGIQWALALYALDLLLMFALAKVALRVVPGKLTGLIMEMHSFKVPSLSIVAKQTWARTKSLMFLVFPVYMLGTAAVQIVYAVGLLGPINTLMQPLTIWWLGLPAIAGILLIFGVVRKELILLTLVAICGPNLGSVLTQPQFIVLATVGMLYLPCLSTISILAREFSWRTSATISAANLVTALLVGGILNRLLSV